MYRPIIYFFYIIEFQKAQLLKKIFCVISEFNITNNSDNETRFLKFEAHVVPQTWLE